MQTVVSNSKLSNHARSISLPPSSHPLLASFEQNLDRFRSFEGASSSSDHKSVCQKLDGLKNLYECLDDVLQLPLSQEAFSQERNGKWEEEVLDGSLRLLDICATVRDIYSQMKETVLELECSLRRKRCGELAYEVNAYMISKTRLNKMICKCYKELKETDKNCTLVVAIKEFELIKMIKEVQEVSVTMLKSTLSFISGPKAGLQPRGLSLVTKLLQSKGPSCVGQSDNATLQKMEVELQLLNNKKENKGAELLCMQNLLKQLGAFDENIQELVEMLEVVFRLLLKTRVSLLNILNH